MSNNENKKPLVSILQYIGLIFTLISVFAGTMYISKGELIISLFVSLFFVIFSFFLIDQMIKRKELISKKKFSSKSLFFWLLFLIITTPAGLIMYHFLNVEVNAKEDVIKITTEKMNQMNEMVSKYETKTSAFIDDYREKLVAEFDDKDHGFNEITDAVLIQKYGVSQIVIDGVSNGTTSIDDISDSKKVQFDSIKDVIKTNNDLFFANYKDVFKNWSRLELNTAFYELDKVLEDNYNLLKEFYDRKTESPSFTFEFEYSKESVALNEPLTLFNKYKPYELSVFVLLFTLLMILPYFLVKTFDYKKPPKKAKVDRSSGLGGQL